VIPEPKSNQKMRRLYLKGFEENQEIFIKVVIKKSLVTASLLIRSSDDSWAIRKKPFDLSKEAEKIGYANFLERYFESNWMEFDAARKLKIKQTKASTKSNQDNFPVTPEDILKKIDESRKTNTDENKDQ
jgi:hypothetical protein